jgi:hypothetical protein
MEPKNRCQGINSASLCSLAGRYDNPIPSRCLAPIEFLKIPALHSVYSVVETIVCTLYSAMYCTRRKTKQLFQPTVGLPPCIVH